MQNEMRGWARECQLGGTEARINIANLFALRSEEPADGVDFLVINVFNVGVHRI